LDFGFDKLTDTDLLIGLPQSKGSETSVALRNQGSLPVSVNVVALTDKGERLSAAANIAEKNFGEALFKTPAKIVRVEIDPEKLYPQIDYSNDIAPREFTENDLLAEIIRAFNRQEFSKAESAARKILQNFRHLDEARTWLGRSLVEQNKLEEAEREFNAALNEKLPTAKTLAWANIGLGEIALRRNQNAQAAIFFNNAVKADAEYGSNLAARNGRIKAENAPSIDEAAKSFFANFDKAVLSRQKAQVDNLLVSGELKRFSNGITGNQPEQWETRILRTEFLDANHLAVDAGLTAKIINREQQSGTALFILARSGNGWKLAQVDLFEVR
jgi:tetratricopeptide (TPR) repeat protein